MKHLWEIQHPYGCGDTHLSYTSWNRFLEEFRDWDADDDLNFVIRWDWVPEGPRFDHLNIIFLQQRRALILKCTIQVTPEEEPDVISYLKNRLKYMKKMWEPLL